MQVAVDDDGLIGRDRERGELERLLAGARAGAGGLVLVTGEAGVGKTRLCRDVLSHSDLHVLTGGARQEAVLPYGPFVTALRAYLRCEPDGLSVVGSLSGYLALLLPELGSTPVEGDRLTLLEALRSAFTAIARSRPTVLFLDDLHWADGTTLDLLPLLAGALAREPLLVVGAYRSDEIPRGHPLRRLRTDLRRAGLLREIVLEPLGREETALLAGRVLGGTPGSSLVASLYDRTEGLPFFVEELTAALRANGHVQQEETGFELVGATDMVIPGTVRDAVLLRLDGLSEQAQHVLEGAAVAGLRFDLELMMHLAGDGEGLEEVLERGLVVEVEEGQGAFRHALTRETIYGEAPWPRRRALHRRVAAWMEAQGLPAGIIAEHWLAGREPERARLALLAAVEHACAVHAYRDAAQAARRALELWPEGEDEQGRLTVLERLGQCAQLSASLGEAARAWREAAQACRRDGDVLRMARAQRQLAMIYALQGSLERALAARQAAADAFAACGLPEEAAADRLAAGVTLRRIRSYARALGFISEALAEAERAGRADLTARALGLQGSTLARLGRLEAGLEKARAGLDLALEANLTGPAAENYLHLGAILEGAANYTDARDAYLTAVDFCEARGETASALRCMGCVASTLERTGAWDQAVRLCKEMLAASETTQEARMVASVVLGEIYAWQGEARRARAPLQEANDLAKRQQFDLVSLLSAGALGYVEDYQGKPSSAARWFRVVLEAWEEIPARHLMIHPLSMAITFFARQGMEAEAHACARALAEVAATVGNAEAMAGLAHALGETALLGGDPAQAARHFDHALSLLHEVAVPFEYAQTQLRSGVALVAAGEVETGVKRLTEAYRAARKLKTRPLTEQVARQLEALGESVEARLGPTAGHKRLHGGLSRRELEVLHLLVSGRTNREIGEALFVSPRTAEMHVSQILAKLDCRTRTEAVRKSSELGLLG